VQYRKNAFLLLCLAILLIPTALVFRPMQILPLSEIPTLTEQELAALTEARTAYAADLYALEVDGIPLPRDAKQRTLYTPALTENISAHLPKTWQAARTAAADGCSKVLLYSRTQYLSYTVIETGLPVIAIDLPQHKLSGSTLNTERTQAKVQILSLSGSQALRCDSDNIELKYRGNSSLSYPKKSFTVFFREGLHQSAQHTPLGLPANHTFALNAVYEDDSKIRDAFAYGLWTQIEPDNAFQLAYAELILNNSYHGLYGLHELPTASSLGCTAADTVYKINYEVNGNPYRTENAIDSVIPLHEIAVGNAQTAPSILQFLKPFESSIETFPAIYDQDNFVNYAVLMEVLSCMDNSFNNFLITLHADTGQYSLTAWDMDQSLGSVWNTDMPRNITNDASLSSFRFLHNSSNLFEPLDILYAECPEFSEAVENRYRELRQTIFTDEALLERAAALYDQLSTCGARQRDAERWPTSAISEDNSFIETFIPARMAFLDREFDVCPQKQP